MKAGQFFPYYYHRISDEFYFTTRNKYLHTERETSYDPFFIVGSGRCGSTMLRVLLEKDSRICIPPESGASFEKSVKYYLKYCKRYKWGKLIKDIFSIYKKDSNWKFWNINLDTNEDNLKDLPPSHQRFDHIIRYIYRTYCKTKKPDSSIWGDKNPYMVFSLKYIIKTFPNAKLINLVRDGRDVIASWYNHKLKYDQLADIGRRWNWSLREAEKFSARYPENMLTVKYEDLVKSTDQWMGRIIGFLGIEYEPDPENVMVSDDLIQPHLIGSQDEINSGNIGKWKDLLSADEIKNILPLISEYMKKYNYLN